jgi:predicted metal-binding protein
MIITLCSSCVLGQTDFADLLKDSLNRAEIGHRIASVECLSGCIRPSAVAFRAAGKTAYLFGDLTAADLADLTRFAKGYAASPDGNFVDARPLGNLRTKALARIPG